MDKPSQVPGVGLVDTLRAKGWTDEQIQAHVNTLRQKRQKQKQKKREGRQNRPRRGR